MEKSKVLLVPMDFEPPSLAALALALQMARDGGQVVVLHAYVMPPFPTSQMPGALYERVHRHVERSARKALDELALPRRVRVLLRQGMPAKHILACADDLGAARIVMGTHGRRGVGRFVLGSVAEEVLRESPIPVVTVRPETEAERPAPHTEGPPVVLCAVDLEAGTQQAIDAARDLGGDLGGGIELCHVYALPFYAYPGFDPTLARSLDAELVRAASCSLERLASECGAARWHLRSGKTGPGILEVVEMVRPAALVLGTHARSGAARALLGSVAEWVLRQSPVPVMTTRLPREPNGAASDTTASPARVRRVG